MISLQVGQLEMMEKEATPEKPKQMGNKEKMRRKEENWEVFFINRITIIYIQLLESPIPPLSSVLCLSRKSGAALPFGRVGTFCTLSTTERVNIGQKPDFTFWSRVLRGSLRLPQVF